MPFHSLRRALPLTLALCYALCGGDANAAQARSRAAQPKPEPKADEAVTALDSDGDKLTDEMEASLGTSPLLADTDGDGFSDYQEVVEYGFDPANDPYKFNPRIADISQLDIEISTAPQIAFDYTTTEGQQKSIEIGNTTDNSWSVQNSFSAGVSFGSNVSAGTTFGLSVGASTEYSFQHSRTTSREQRHSLATSQSSSESKDKTTQGGRMLVGVKLHNRGNVQLSVESLRLLAVKVPVENPDRPKIVSQLELDTKFTLGGIAKIKPHSSTPGELIFRADLNLSQMRDLLQDGSLIVRVADFSLSGAEAFTDINAKTATVVIDPGPGPEGSGNTARTYLVAAYSPDGQRGIGVGEVLRKVLYRKYEVGTTSWKYGDPDKPEKLRAGTTRSGLRSLMGRTNNYETNGYWVVRHTTRIGSEAKAAEYNPLLQDYALDGIRVHSGHILELTYLLDSDRGGLDYRTELMLGTDPLKRDTDGDGLTDAEEVAGWTVTKSDGTQRMVHSDPLQVDSDGDGLSDVVEKQLKTDPHRRNFKAPSVVGRVQSQGANALKQERLRCKVVTREEPEQPDVILEQSPRSGDLVEEGAEITLVVSRPSAQVTVPSVVGKSRDDAMKLLTEAGLKPSLTSREDWDNKAGLVLEQSGVPGGTAARGETIILVVAREPRERWIEFKHHGAYVAKFYLSWEDEKGPHHWASGKKAVGYSHRQRFEGKNTRNIRINAQADTGFGWKDIWRLKLDAPPDATYTAKGTTLNRSYSKSP